MAYYQNTPPTQIRLVARKGYMGPQSMDGWFDDAISGIKGAVSNVVNFYGQAQQNAGIASLAQQQAAAQAATQQAAAAPGIGGISTSTMLVVGGLALGAILLLRK